MTDGRDVSFESPQILMNSIRNTVFVLGFSVFSALAASHWIGKNLDFIRPGTRKSSCFLMHLLLFYIMCLCVDSKIPSPPVIRELWNMLLFVFHPFACKE